MEPLGSTFSQPSVSDFPTDRGIDAVRRAPSGPATSKADDGRLGVIASKNAPEQKGFQPTEQTVGEFRPYSKSGSHKSQETTAEIKSQSNITSAGGTQEKQDPQVQAQIERLKAIEVKVKAHEAAHKSAGGTMTGPVSYSYTRGPDGKNYITGGEVPITISSGKTPQETIGRMQQVIQAALAPADPSPQDRAVAAQAAAQQLEASQQLSAGTATTASGSPPTVSAEPRDQADSVVARDAQRAYGNSAVTGAQPEIPAIAVSALYNPERVSSPRTNTARSSVDAQSPSQITGIGVPHPVSYYA